MMKEPSSWNEAFVYTWIFKKPENLNESPQKLNQPDNSLPLLVYNINEFSKANKKKVFNLGKGWWKYQGEVRYFYWFKKKNQIILAAELDLRSHALVVSMVAKNPEYKGQYPFGSDLYAVILNDQKDKAIRLSSDQMLSDGGLKIWANLLTTHKIHVYNSKNPGQTFHQIADADDLKNYFGDDPKYHDFQFILTETKLGHLEVKTSFESRRLRELAGYRFIDDMQFI